VAVRVSGEFGSLSGLVLESRREKREFVERVS
jgi:hypothetical protein